MRLLTLKPNRRHESPLWADVGARLRDFSVCGRPNAFGFDTPRSRGLEDVENGMPHRPDVHRWYCTAGWQRRRAHQLLVEPLCRLCLEAGRVTPATVADHVEPHRGDLTRSSSVRSAACAPTATMGSTGIMPRAH